MTFHGFGWLWSTARTIAIERLNRKEGSSETDVFGFSTPQKKETLVTVNGPRSIMSQLSAARLLEFCYGNGVRF